MSDKSDADVQGLVGERPVDLPFVDATGFRLVEGDTPQGPQDIMTQYGQSEIPGSAGENRAMNLKCGLDNFGHAIEGARLSPMAAHILETQHPAPADPPRILAAGVADQATLAVVTTPNNTSDEGTVTHVAIPGAKLAWWAAVINKIEAGEEWAADELHQLKLSVEHALHLGA